MKRFDGIIGAKGFGALVIIAYHVYVIGEFFGSSNILDQTIGIGGIFVPLFFMLSAFGCMCGYYNKFVSEEFKFSTIERFYFGRVKKIVPTFYAALLFHSLIVYFKTGGFNLFGTVGTMSMLFGFMPQYRESGVDAGWAIGIEIIFYLIFPVFCVCLKNKKRSWIALIITCVILLAYVKYYALNCDPLNNSEINIVRHLIYFVGGAIIFHYIEDIENIKYRKAVYALCLIIMLISFLLLKKLSGAASIIFIMVFFATLIINQIGFNDRILNNCIFKFFGKISYQLYMFHMVIYKLLYNSGLMNRLRIFDNMILNYLVTYITVVLLTVILSVLYNKVEAMVLQKSTVVAKK